MEWQSEGEESAKVNSQKVGDLNIKWYEEKETRFVENDHDNLKISRKM